jgi:hypothetical protein
MPAMKRLLFVVVAAAAFASTTAVATASVPCRDRIYNDWYADGKVATTYDVACYRDALKHIPTDAREYSSLADDIRRALHGALARRSGAANVPEQIGNGGKGAVKGVETPLTRTTPVDSDPPASTDRPQSPTSSPSPSGTSTIAAPNNTSSEGSGIPVPILVLGALALLLVAAGAAGAGLKHRRR